MSYCWFTDLDQRVAGLAPGLRVTVAEGGNMTFNDACTARERQNRHGQDERNEFHRPSPLCSNEHGTPPAHGRRASRTNSTAYVQREKAANTLLGSRLSPRCDVS